MAMKSPKKNLILRKIREYYPEYLYGNGNLYKLLYKIIIKKSKNILIVQFTIDTF